jgi:hypothetical protein
MTIQEKTAVTLAAVGLLVTLVSLPLYFRKVGRNPLYGFRIAKAFESEENWYRINQHGARGLILWGLLMVAWGASCLLMPAGDVDTAAKIGFVSIAVPIVWTLLYARNL